MQPHELYEQMRRSLIERYGELISRRDLAKIVGTSPESLGNVLRRNSDLKTQVLRANKRRFGRRVFPKSYERLLNFFEALAEFCAVVHLSAFSANDVLWGETKGKLIEGFKQQSLSFERATFGMWKYCVEFLASRVRQMLHDAPEVCFATYRTRNPTVLEAIASKKLVGVLQEANSIRNTWSGHVGAVSDAKAEHVRNLLVEHLASVRSTFGAAWSNYQLIQPLQCKIRHGIYQYEARVVMGTRSMPFESADVELTEGMEDGQLHLWSPGEDKALQLLPMIKIMPSPRTEENACYFYNRRQSGGIRFLSYYFETDADIVETFEDTASILDALLSEPA